MITSKDNEMIKHVSKLLSSSSYRKECQCFVAEGARLCMDGVLSGAVISAFLYTKDGMEKYSQEFEKILSASQRNFEISEPLFKKISDTNSPQGLLCVFSLDKKTLSDKIEKGKYYAALENIQDPSNMGTILRTAEALDISGVILSKDCCDIYSPKVTRGSMGAIFRLNIIIAENFTEYISEISKSGIMTYASTPRNAEDIENTDFSKGGIMLIGNEGNGLKEETIKACSKRVKINMKGRAESLNAAAAAAILLYRFQQ